MGRELIIVAKSENLTNQVYQTLKDKIINNEVLPNTYLDEKVICESLGVSRTPVREALARLEQDGLVVFIPRRGVMVSDLSLQTIIELIHIRKVMEPSLLRPYFRLYDKDVLRDFRDRQEKALENEDVETFYKLDYEFHKYLYEGTKKRHIIKLLSYVSDQHQRIRSQDYYRQRRLTKGAKDHIQIIDALLHDEYDLAYQLLLTHTSDMEAYYHGLLMSDMAAYGI